MLTRREALRRIGAATIAGFPAARTLAAVRTPLDFDVPPGACDCHVHVIEQPARFPMAPDRVYTPPMAPVGPLLELHRALHIDRVVVIQPSVYGTDNGVTLDALQRLGDKRSRGVAVVAETARAADLDAMRDAGIRGIRLNLETSGQVEPAEAARRLKIAVAQCAPRNWHIQIYTRPATIAALADLLASSPVPIVFDHFAGAQAAAGLGQSGFDAVLSLLRSGRAYVKLSAPYRASKVPPYDDVAPLAQALVATNPDRVLWGSDWPHPDSAHTPGKTATDITPFLPIDDGQVLDGLARWIPQAELRRKILVDNPARLYEFS